MIYLKRVTCYFFLSLLLLTNAFSQEKNWKETSIANREERLKWWTHDRFGMFIHWGLYALPARHEWVQEREQIDHDTYKNKYFNLFDPDLYNPEEWARLAKEAGMKYVVLTAKHHEGFCLWDTKTSDFNAAKTPYGKDLIKPFVEACRKNDLKVGFYFSVIDWYHPDFTIDENHPLRNNKEARAKNSYKNMDTFRKYLKDQLRELLSNYGTIDLLFWDFSYPGEDGKSNKDWDSEGLIKIARELQPNIIMNDRLDMYDQPWGWDYKTPEQFMPNKWPEYNGKRVPWETCQTFSGSWGYNRDENTWKSDNQLITMLIEVVSKGGNLLLNVGPTARGSFDQRAKDRLEAIGEWMALNNQSIYGCTEAPDEFKKPENCLLTYNPQSKKLYVHLLQYPFQTLYLPDFKGKVKYAQFLHDHSEIKFTSRSTAKEGGHMTITAGENDLIMQLPVIKPNVEIPVIELILN